MAAGARAGQGAGVRSAVGMPASGPIFVGLDCGGSSCRVLAVDGAGVTLFSGQSGAANLVSTPESRLRRNLRHAAQGCPPPTAACGCFAGLINEAMRARALAFLGELFPIARLRAEPDYTAALYAAEGADLCVVAGTGSLVCSADDAGRVVKSGGRGYILGDEGSGFVYGRDALRWFLRHPEEATPGMARAIEELLGSLVEPEIVTAVHRAPSPATILAKLVKPLAADAGAGEAYALASVARGSAELAEVAAGHVGRYLAGRREVSVALAGGVWKASPLYRRAFEEALGGMLPGVALDVRRITEAPVLGAVRLARETVGDTGGEAS